MRLRTRLTLLAAGIVAAVLIGACTAAYFSTRSNLVGEVDTFLVGRAAPFVNGHFTVGSSLPTPHGPTDAQDSNLVQLDAVTQVIDADGKVVASIDSEPALPVTSADVTLAKAAGRTVVRDVTVDGVHYRLLTASISGNRAVQIARALTETDDVLGGLRRRLLAIGGIGTGLAALAAWLMGRRAARAIEAVTAAATTVARTQDLSVPVPTGGGGEAGELAESFNTMLGALATSRRQQHRLVADASHELRTPLTALRTNIEFLQRAPQLDVAQRVELVDEALLEIDALTELVAELVDLATDARAEEPVAPVDLGQVAEAVAERFRRRSGRPVTVTLASPAVVPGRVGMVERAVSNLVDNALKFSPPPTGVRVGVDHTEITVTDAGPGIDPEDRVRIFDRFYRADTARTLPGSGLGLAIVKQAAELHGGTVCAEAGPDGGTTFRLRFPATSEPDPVQRP